MQETAWLIWVFVVAFTPTPRAVKDFNVSDVKGNKHLTADWRDAKAIVMLFLGTDCPVSNSYCPEFVRLESEFSKRGVRFYGVHTDSDTTVDVAATHAREFALSFPILLDPKQIFARTLGVRVVPEAAVLAPDGQLLYSGRVDDRYSLDGKRRDYPTQRDLENALANVLQGKKPAIARRPAFGCPLPMAKDG
jgi:peroxiredoxin